MLVFKGIRYAKAKRFGKPEQEPPLSSLEDVVTSIKICPQNPSRLGKIMGRSGNLLEQSEDCLRLAIHTPSTEGSLPVLVWIHGGAYLTGSGLYEKYDATELAREGDIVVVSISYRLGAFGFLYDPEAGIENLGIQDQVCALRWVRDNIRLFGGNPDDVTVFGQSAGGYSVLHHIASVKEPLFSKAIIASAPFYRVKRRTMRRNTQAWYKGIEGNSVDCPQEEMLKAQEVISEKNIGMPFCAVCNDITRPVAVVPGLKAVKLWCQQDDAAPFVPYRILTGPVTALLFRNPMRKYASYLEKFGIEATSSVMTWRHGESRWGATHCMELPLLFGDFETWKDAPFMDGIGQKEYECQASLLRTDLLKFIKD